jgi:Cdc6-like AAA superfamily ATPase
MTSDQQRQVDFKQRAVDAGTAFSPTSPIDVRALFAGRDEQIRMIVDAINQKGQHAILFGERGVGKTSLANVFPSYLSGPQPILAPRINCDATDGFDSVWRKVFDTVQMSRPVNRAGFGPTAEQMSFRLSESIGDATITPDRARRELVHLGALASTIIIIDEFDRLPASVRRPFADLIKSLSDHAVAATIILVGVADSVEQLIEEHHSVERALVQVPMPRMSAKEIEEILDKGTAKLGMRIDPIGKARIRKTAQGLPHYAHLLGLHAARVALDAQRLMITQADVTAAMKKAVTGAQASVRSAYEVAVRSSQKANLFESVLLACAMTPANDLGFFAAKDVREPLGRITGKKCDVPVFAQHLNEFADGKRGDVLVKEGTARLFRYRFKSPLMQPFVILRGIEAGRITPEALD